jgi:hypothetical protein
LQRGNPVEINYKTYTRDELLEAKASFDREKDPENYENLIGEISRRSKRGEDFKNKLTPKEISAINKLKILGWLQIAAAFVIAFFVVSAAGFFDLLVGLIAIGLNGLAGWYLIKGNILGYRLSIVNQGLQTIVIVSSGIVYGYSGIGGIYILFQSGLDEWALGFDASVNPGFRFLMGDIQPPYLFGVDVLAVFFIVVLSAGIKIVKKTSC